MSDPLYDSIWRAEQVIAGNPNWQIVRRYISNGIYFRETAKDATKKVREFGTQAAAQTAANSLNP